MRNQKVTDLVYLAMLMAIIILLAFVPYLGLYKIGPISFTIIHIPVIIATVYLNRRLGILTGAIFGISTFIVAYTQVIEAPGTIDFMFRDPYLAIVPRMLFPYLTAVLYDSFKTIFKNEYLRLFIAGLAGSFMHSILVLTAIFFQFQNVLYLEKALYLSVSTVTFTVPFFNTTITLNFIKDGFKFIGFIFLTSSIAEAIVSGFVVTAIVMALRAFKNKSDNNDTDELTNQMNEE